MCMKSYAIIAAVSLRNRHHRSHHNATIRTAPIQKAHTINALNAIITSTVSVEETEDTTAKGTATATASSSFVSVSNASVPPDKVVTTGTLNSRINGGLGVFHQQNLRSTSNNNNNNANNNVIYPSYSNTLNGNANLLLGGAMLSLITTILCVVCYCCHRNIKKRTEAAYRQQRQWLENDSNLEVYSVEQCYETTGLFLSESTDGLAVISALHHEPPPSYDAVVAMQEQHLLAHHQQQVQRHSPPPDYRSSLDVNASSLAVCTLASCRRGTPDGMSANDNNNTNGSHFDNAPCHIGSSSNNGNNNNNIMENNGKTHPNYNLQKMLSTQSCCTLQRGEFEHMWHMPTHVVPVPQCDRASTTSITTTATSTPTTANTALIAARKSLPNCSSCNTNTNNNSNNNISIFNQMPTLSRKYLSQSDHSATTLDSMELIVASNNNNLDSEMSNNANTADDKPFHQTNETEMSLLPMPTTTNSSMDNLNSWSPTERPVTSAQCNADRNANALTSFEDNATVSYNNNNNNSPNNNNNNNDNENNEPQLDALNGNGMVRLDMSKIIDKTGLPTYDGALKLDSHGYV